jgi:hypothetical protein
MTLLVSLSELSNQANGASSGKTGFKKVSREGEMRLHFNNREALG